MPPAPHAASSHLLQQIPLWRRLPRELQHAVLERTDVATAVRVQDENMAQLLVKRDLCIADMATQRAWWTAVLETSWLPGAKILLDAYVPYLPVLQEDALAPTPEILQLLLSNEMVLPPDSPISEPGQQLAWQLDNIDTLMTLVCRLSSDTPQRSQMLQQIRKQRIGLCPRTSDIEALDMCKYKPDLDQVLRCLLPGSAGKQHGVKISTWMQSKHHPIDLPLIARHAASTDCLPVLQWACAQLGDRDLQLEGVAFQHNAVQVLEDMRQSPLWEAARARVRNNPIRDGYMSPTPYNRLDFVTQAQWLQYISPSLLSGDHFSRPAHVGNLPVLCWLHQHRPDIDCPPDALRYALMATQTEVVTFLTEHYPTAVASLRHMDCSRCLQVAALRGDVATLDWFLAHHPAVFAEDSIPFNDSLFPPAVWEWLIDHPDHAAWALGQQIPLSDMYAHFVSRVVSARSKKPLCTRSLYDKLTPRRPRQSGAGYYFAQSAIAANDIEWLRQVSSDFDTPINRYCDTDLLYETEHLSLLQQLYEEGHLAIPPEAVLRFLVHKNLAGAHWVLRRHWRDDLELHPVMFAQNGHLAILQFVLGKRDMCLQCLVNAAKRAGQHHVLAWCRDQRRNV
ncbi:hypothetical protein RI367_007835 [Sorochytrium milnesiophthora]